MPNNTVLKEKQEEVKKLAEKIKLAKVVILSDYRGINVLEVTALRNELRKLNADYKVIKNNITKRALEENNITELSDVLEGPISITLSYDSYSEAAKAIADYAEKAEKTFAIKAGIIDGKVVDEKSIKALAKLPSKEVLISKALGGLNAPISGFANVLNANITGLVRTLNQIAQKSA